MGGKGRGTGGGKTGKKRASPHANRRSVRPGTAKTFIQERSKFIGQLSTPGMSTTTPAPSYFIHDAEMTQG